MFKTNQPSLHPREFSQLMIVVAVVAKNMSNDGRMIVVIVARC